MASTSTPQASAPPTPLSQIVLHKEDLNDESLTLLNQIITNHNQLLNYLLGHSGPITLNNHLNMGGKTITGVVTNPNPSPTDVVTKAVGDSQYGPAAIAPQLESLAKNVMKSYRRLNDQNQQEAHSSFLNSCQSTSPTANTSFVTFGAAGGGTVSATVGAGFHQKLDGSTIPYATRTDTLALPVSFAVMSLTRTANIVTYVGAATGLGVDDGFTIINAGDPSFNGTFVVLQVLSSTSFTYFQGGPDGSTASGSVSVGGVYYYTLGAGHNVLGLVGGFSSDTWTNRRSASFDGTTIIAVVVTTAAGGDTVNSAGGGTPPHSNTAVTVVRRL